MLGALATWWVPSSYGLRRKDDYLTSDSILSRPSGILCFFMLDDLFIQSKINLGLGSIDITWMMGQY